MRLFRFSPIAKLSAGIAVGIVVGFVAAAIANTLSPNKGFNVPTPNGDLNLWGPLLDTDITSLDTMLGGIATVPITSTQQTATAAAANTLVQKLTGSLSGNTTYLLPGGFGGFWIIDNETTGNFTLTVQTSAINSTGIVVPQTVKTLVYSDGTNVSQVAPPINAGSGQLPSSNGGVPAGAIFYFYGTSPPSGYLAGDGSCISPASFPALGTLLPTGSCTGGNVQLPDCRARALVGYDAGNATGRLTANTSEGISASTLGNTGGAQSDALTVAQLPTLTVSGSGSTNGGSSYSASGATAGGSGSGSGPALGTGVGGGGGGDAFAVVGGGNATYSLSSFVVNAEAVTVTVPSVSVSVSASTTGTTDSAHGLVPPAIVADCVIRAY